MKKIMLFVMALLITACSGDNSTTESSIVELQVGNGDVISAKRVSGEISSVGEVDLYHVRAVETDRTLQIKCSSDTVRTDVDLLVHVFEMNDDGELVMIAGDHAPEGSLGAVTIKINVPVTEPRDLYVHVRDLKDDESGKGNPYYISAYYEAAPDGNGSFETAADLVMNGPSIRDNIGAEDDGDCFRISVAEAGVYDILVNFQRLAGSAVRLNFTLYDGVSGDIIETRKQGNVKVSHLVHYLVPGEYIMVVGDQGKDDFDPSSPYDISVDQLNVAEVMENDALEADLQPDDAMFDGASIDYYEDLDVYAIDSDVAGDITLMNLQFSSLIPITYRIELYTGASLLLNLPLPDFSHDYRGGDNGDGLYQVGMKLDAATYFMVVKAASGAEISTASPYTAEVAVTGIEDDDESFDHGDGVVGNDADYKAIDLTAHPSPEFHTGKIAYRTDVDYYKVTVPADAARKQVLSFNLDIPETELVQYAMKITKEGVNNFEKTVFNSGEDQRALDIRTSFLVPESDEDSVYYVKVYDFQDDNGEDASFNLSWNVVDVHGAPELCTKPGVNTATVYHDENDEENFPQQLVITYPDTRVGNFKVDNNVFDITDTVNAPRTGSDPVTISFPWVSGYIDYQNDEDWFVLDLSQPLSNGDAEWYYTISVELYADGSPVEYTWEYMPNSDGLDGDGKVQVNTEWCHSTARYCENGIQAGDGDKTIGLDLVNLSLVSSGYNNGSLWIGKGSLAGSTWAGKAYFRITDFNFLRTVVAPNIPNPVPDDDWGYEEPYYFRLTVKYYKNGLEPPAAK